MSAAIKKMLAEREAVKERRRIRVAVENSPKKIEEIAAAMKMVDLAQPFIDEHATDLTKWKPSQLLRIGYCTLATSDSSKSALQFVERHLGIARERYMAGLDPNPFSPTLSPLPEPPAE
jgi:hypothetical protein